VYTYSTGSGNGQQGSAPSSTAPVALAAPGTRTFTVSGARFCGYVAGLSTVLINGYPLMQDVGISGQNIVKWTSTQVTFKLPDSVPSGMYGVTVRGYQKYGYCDDVKVGFIKMN